MKYMCDFEGGFGAEVEAEGVGTAAINFCEDHASDPDGLDATEPIVVNVTDEEGDTTIVNVKVNVKVTFGIESMQDCD